MTETYQIELDDLSGELGPLPDPSTPAGEALAWWLESVRQRTYVGLKEELPSAPAIRVLRDRQLIAETPGSWAFVIRSPHSDAEAALRRNVWGLVAAAMERYAPAAIDRVSAVRLATGDESILPKTWVRHGASESKRTLQLAEGYSLLLHPDATLWTASPGTSEAVAAHIDTTTVKLSTTPVVSVSVVGPAPLLMSLTVGDLRDNLDTIVIWLRTLLVGRAALERAFSRDPRPVLLKRMGDLARDAGNTRLANTIDEVVSAHSRGQISRSLTGVGRQFLVPGYLSSAPAAASPWLERHRARMARALDTASSLLASREAAMPRLDSAAVLAVARAAKAEDTYHSTTIEGYRITREEVRAVIEGQQYAGRSAAETERLMALKGYAQAFDWTLVRIREAQPPAARPSLTEAFILDLFLELWAPSVDARLVTAPDFRDWRNQAVQINSSDHVPPAWEKLRGLMTQFVSQLNDADVGPLARAVVAHWGFVHLHPFKDGNGRVARLMMNYLLGAAGLPWTTIRAEERARYFAALERAHVHEDIVPFAEFIAGAVERSEAERE
jgi:Fic family protein